MENDFHLGNEVSAFALLIELIYTKKPIVSFDNSVWENSNSPLEVAATP